MSDPANTPDMELAEEQEVKLHDVHRQAVADLLDADGGPPNLVGVGLGVKWTGGEPTGKPAVLALVTHKVPDDELPEPDRVPAKVGRAATDVLAVGELIAGGGPPAAQSLATRIRPAEGGYSVGHVNITAGTIATCVYDILPRGCERPPAGGAGIPPAFYILSNNHVLADSNAASPGDAIVQPGPVDGGADPADRIALLSNFVPITFDPPTPRANHNNLVDAAVARGQFHELDREIYWIGYIRAWRRRRGVRVGMKVQKTGRTTNYTLGCVTAVRATVDINYSGRVARFRDQIVTTNMSAGGDSGSLVSTTDDVAVGLLFAGSPIATIVNQIEHVRSLLRVEVAEEVG